MNKFIDALWISLPLPALLLDPGDVIAEVNPSSEDFFNIAARSLRGQPLLDLLAVDAPLEDVLSRVRRDQSSISVNTVEVGSGQRAPIECNIQFAPMIGMPGFVLAILEPRVTALRLGRSASVKSAAKSAIGMAEMLAHEIKNPLAGITGAAQLLGMNLTGEDLEMTDLIVAESRRIVALLDQVEQFGNLRKPEQKIFNIHDLLDRARRSASVGFAAKMKIIEQFDPLLPPTRVDGDQMLQVFLNLLKNASEAAGADGGTITIHTFYEQSLRLRRKDGTAKLPLQIEIIDDGPGLPPDLEGDIFDPFVSGRENGTGLGLALVSKIITENDGWISVTSQPGRTCFRISLPVADPRDDAADTNQEE